MINIKISDTGFASGDAWSILGYKGELNSQQIMTVYPEVDDETAIYGYKMKSGKLGLTEDVIINSEGICEVPNNFMTVAGPIHMYFYTMIGNEYVFKSQSFDLIVRSNSVDGGMTCPKTDTAGNFIVVKSILERDSIPVVNLADGKVVKVNDIGNGKSAFFSWNDKNQSWDTQDFDTGLTIPDIYEDVAIAIKETVQLTPELVNGSRCAEYVFDPVNKSYFPISVTTVDSLGDADEFAMIITLLFTDGTAKDIPVSHKTASIGDLLLYNEKDISKISFNLICESVTSIAVEFNMDTRKFVESYVDQKVSDVQEQVDNISSELNQLKILLSMK